MPKISDRAITALRSAVILSVPPLSIPLLAGMVTATSPYQMLSPMTRQGYAWTVYAGGGLDPNGYFFSPTNPERIWGVPLADGFYLAPAAWEDSAPINLVFQVQGGYVVRQDWDFSQARPNRSWFGF